MTYHSLLLRQLKRLGIKDVGQAPTREQWLNTLDRVSRAYTEADQDRYLLERSQLTSSRELHGLYDRLEEAQRIARLGNWSLERGGAKRQFSDQFFRILGLEPSSPGPTVKELVKLTHKQDRRLLLRSVDVAFRHGTEFEIEFRVRHSSGDTRWVQVIGQPVRTGDNAVARVHGTAMDITRRKLAEERILALNEELEQRVEERTRQLEVTNCELESFSYSVSHDLRTPLRGINGFARILIGEYGDRLGEDGRHYLSRLVSAASHMANLIDGLLQLARVSRAQLHRAPVDLSQMAGNIVAELRRHEPDRNPEIVIAENMSDRGDPTLVRIALENLLANAWKYTARQPKARMEFGRKIQSGSVLYYVRDNGAGFDMQYAGKLFHPFHRLHSGKEFPGTGVGLATVKRIIDAHGGRIWAEADLGKGATFHFTLGSGSQRRHARTHVSS